MRRLGVLPSGWLGSVLSTDPNDSRPFLVNGVRVRFDPIERKAVRAARYACATTLKETGDMLAASDALTVEMLRHGIVEWEGVGDADGVPIAPSDLMPVLVDGVPVLDVEGAPIMRPAVDQFLADTDLVEAAEVVYVRPWLNRDQEKNASAASSTGISEAGTAANGIATGSANGGKTAVARPNRTATRKKPGKAASTSRASRAAKRAKASSKS